MINAGVYVGLPYNDSAPDLGAFETEGIPNSSDDINSLTEFKLHQNYPNPFNPSTNFDYSINAPGNVKLEIYDILGNKINELVNEYQAAGNFSIKWNVNNSQGFFLPSGIYFVRLQWERKQKTIKITLLR